VVDGERPLGSLAQMLDLLAQTLGGSMTVDRLPNPPAFDTSAASRAVAA
jgi:hypothetical protein